MSNSEDKKWDFETGARIQERGQFYSLTLAFALLALTVETAQLDDSVAKAVLETVGTLSLLLSGGAGLWRLLNIPGLYKINVHIHSLTETSDEAQKLKARGEIEIWSPRLQ